MPAVAVTWCRSQNSKRRTYPYAIIRDGCASRFHGEILDEGCGEILNRKPTPSSRPIPTLYRWRQAGTRDDFIRATNNKEVI